MMVFNTLILYDDFKTPAKWMTAGVSILLGMGLYELCCDPYRGYQYSRVIVVIEEMCITTLCAPFYFSFGLYLVYYLRLEIEHRNHAEALIKEELEAKANFLSRVSHEIRSPVCHYK